MRGLSAAEILLIWERGRGLAPSQQAMLLLMAADRDESPERLARLSIGQRDKRLLELRAQTFGPRLDGLTGCPACGENLEVKMNAPDLRADCPTEGPEDRSLSWGEYELRFRLPNCSDVASLARDTDISAARGTLLGRCLLGATRGQKSISLEELPEAAIGALSKEVVRAEPLADFQLALRCPQCAHEWQTPFDIVSFFWNEISSRAARLLREVHALASAYGWSESEILGLSPSRRQGYLEMVPA